MGVSILQIVDISGRKEAEATLLRQAIRDSLTLLPNRDFFTERLRDALSRKPHPGSGLAVFFIDLDNFKLVNDSAWTPGGRRAARPRLGTGRPRAPPCGAETWSHGWAVTSSP